MLYVGIASFLVAMGATWIATPGVIRLAGLLGDGVGIKSLGLRPASHAIRGVISDIQG